MITDDRPEIDVLYAVENVGLDEGAGLAEMSDELFHLVTLGAAAASAGRTVLGETAGALDEMKIVGISPGLDVSFFHKIEGADQLHALKVLAVQLGHHGFNLGTVEHAHEDGLDDIVKMVAQGNLVAAEFFGVGLEIAAAHSRAEIAGILVDAGYDIEDLGLKNGQRNS